MGTITVSIFLLGWLMEITFLLDTKDKLTGLRRAELVQEKSQMKRFVVYFRINNIPVYCAEATDSRSLVHLQIDREGLQKRMDAIRWTKETRIWCEFGEGNL